VPWLIGRNLFCLLLVLHVGCSLGAGAVHRARMERDASVHRVRYPHQNGASVRKSGPGPAAGQELPIARTGTQSTRICATSIEEKKSLGSNKPWLLVLLLFPGG